MHPKFISYLCCPETAESLTLCDEQIDEQGLIQSGTLKSPSGKSYPIIRGVPRFVSEEFYSESFGYEWKKWSRVQFEDQNIHSRMKGHTTIVFDKATGFSEENIAGKTVVEFGCGPGRFLDIVRKRKGIAIGLELSTAVDEARENFKHDLDTCIVQGDILKPPFKKNIFDCAFSIGVLHHTPAPDRSFKKMVEVVKSGGQVTCCVYENNNGKGLYDSIAVIRYRKFFNSIPPGIAHALALAYSYFSAYVLYWFFAPAFKIPGLSKIASMLSRNVFPGLYYLRDVRWRVLDTFDAITPKFASTHTPEELQKWYSDEGCIEIQQMPFCKTAYKGIKKIICAE